MIVSVPSQVELERMVTGRLESFFSRDIAAGSDRMSEAVRGRRILVVGGGGSIGCATTKALLALRPASLHMVDISENYLAEIVRDVRSATSMSDVELQTHVFDYGGAMMLRFLTSTPRFDVVLNFAAVKHVRSEKDVYSLLHMIDVNIVRLARFKRWLAETGYEGRLFTVSTDKAANPTSLMGASKRVMEDVAFDSAPESGISVSSARFANVAFSNGSLLQSFLVRLDKRQPLAVPRGTRRYFVSHAEAADICLLASLAAPSGYVLVPAFEPACHLVLLEDVARQVLARYGYSAWLTDDEAAAREAIARLPAEGKWPVLLTPLDTSGEKPYEEFAGAGETARNVGFTTVLGIAHPPQSGIDAVVRELESLVQGGDCSVDKANLVELIGRAVPSMRHLETGRSLDQRM